MESISINVCKDFETVFGIITAHRNRVAQRVNGESILMVWEVGSFVSERLKTAKWGSGVVRQLAEFIHTQDPTVRGWSYRTIYKMVQFYETYSTKAFSDLITKVKPDFLSLGMIPESFGSLVPIQLAQSTSSPIVPIKSAQAASCNAALWNSATS